VNLDRTLSVSTPTDAKEELRCSRCGYQAIVSGRRPCCPMCGATTWDDLEPASTRLTARVESSELPSRPTTRPTWETVEDVLADLSAAKSSIAAAGRTYRLEHYQPNWRVLSVTDSRSRWVEVEDIRACWNTFEGLGRIQRGDVLDPGRCASFMMALFEQVPGVERTAGDSLSLDLP
jgi:primosomal protein N'